MNYKFFLISIVLCVFCYTTKCETRPVTGMAQETKTLDIQYSPELYPLINNWVNEYQAVKPSAGINAIELPDLFYPEDNVLRFISGEAAEANMQTSDWRVVVGHDAIVPIINMENPLLKEIDAQGITAEKLALLFNNSDELNWATLLDDVERQPLHFYMLDDESVKHGVANYINSESDLIQGKQVSNSEELISAIRKDEYAIGFCRLKDIRKGNSNEWVENIKLAPLDKNGNRRIDNFENIYHTPNAFARGVWIGKYPSSLCGNIYAVSKRKPTDDLAIQFLTWILSDGGQFLNAYGYSDLASAEKEEYIALLMPDESALMQADSESTPTSWVFIFLGVIAAGVIVVYLLGKLTVARSTSPSSVIRISKGLNESTIKAPKGLYFDKTHTWSFIEKDGLVRVGLDDFMQHITGDITRVMLKKPGEVVRKGEEILKISRLGKQLIINSPITGTIQQYNSQLLSDSALINASPYTDGWVYLIEPLNWLREIQSMLMADAYKEWVKTEFMRLKVFLSYAVRQNTSAYEHIILQDGGELHDHVLADLEPEVWEEFQTKFIDGAR